MLYKKLKNILDFILFILLLIVVSSALPFNLPIKSYIVVTGSMEPTIKAGSFIVSQSFTKNKIDSGDIVTFRSPKNSQTIVVHRISQISNNSIFTKGDNNQSPDDWQINRTDILGKPFFVVPYVGTFFNSIHRPLGFIFIIGLPALIFIILQVLTIRSELLKIENKKNIKTLLVLVPFVLLFSQKIHALFLDSIIINGISFTISDLSSNQISSQIESVVFEDQKIKIGYSPSIPNFDQLKICYSQNLGSWQCFLSDKVPSFSPPNGDGIYCFNTIIGKNGIFENKDYAQSCISVEVDQTPSTSHLNLQKSLDSTPAFLGQALYEYQNFSLSASNPNMKFHFSLPQNINSYIYFDYDGQSQDICDNSNFKVSVNNETILLTGPKEFSPSSWIDLSGLQNFFQPLSVGQSIQNIDLDFSLSNSASLDTVFNISNLKIYPISLRVGNTFVPVIDFHDTGSGVGETSVSQSNNQLEFSSSDILGNQENPQTIKVQVMPEVVFNNIAWENVTLYKNVESDLSTFYFSNSSGQTMPVTGINNNLPSSFVSNGVVKLHRQSGDIIDEFNFAQVKNDSSVWKRTPDGIGTWILANSPSEKIQTNFEINRQNNKLLMTISNIPSSFDSSTSDFLEYTINYKTIADSKQIYSKISSSSVKNSKVDREFYLGTCSSGGTCVPENISVGQTIELVIKGQFNDVNIGSNIWQVPY